ncbi:MAG: cytochrome C oxidase subunit IV family protein [Verrucomicrobia bacterium]|nr:cytochrome C oxidase subunit IV family protein [Verrucomicrobiota bacterium]
METHDAAVFKRHIRQYIGVFVALLVATVLTVAVSYVHFGAEDSHVGNVTVAMIIATVKAALVAGFFMHLVAEKRSIYTMLATTGVFFVALIALTVFAFYDSPGSHDALKGGRVATEAVAHGH